VATALLLSVLAILVLVIALEYRQDEGQRRRDHQLEDEQRQREHQQINKAIDLGHPVQTSRIKIGGGQRSNERLPPP
jgi:hypothetical protein